MSDNDLSSIFEIEICLDASFILKEKIQKKEKVLQASHSSYSTEWIYAPWNTENIEVRIFIFFVDDKIGDQIGNIIIKKMSAIFVNNKFIFQR